MADALADLADEDAEMTDTEKTDAEKRRAQGRPSKKASECAEVENGDATEDMEKALNQDPEGNKADASKDEGPKAQPSASASVAKDARFKAMAPLHLGLNLKIGTVYTAAELQRRCQNNKGKLASLEKFMKDRKKLEPIASPAGQENPVKLLSKKDSKATKKNAKVPAMAATAASAASKTSAPDSSPPAPPNKRIKMAKADESQTRPTKYLAGQIVWHTVDGGSHLAKIVGIAEGPGLPYRIRYISNICRDDDSDDTTRDAKVADLRPFNVTELPEHFSSASASSKAEHAVHIPADRDSKDFSLGQVVWFMNEKRPSWPAKIQVLPANGDDKYRVQLFNTQGGVQDGEVIPATSSQLLAFEKDDMQAFVQVSKAVQDALQVDK